MAAKIGLDYEAIDANIPLTAFGERVWWQTSLHWDWRLRSDVLSEGSDAACASGRDMRGDQGSDVAQRPTRKSRDDQHNE